MAALASRVRLESTTPAGDHAQVIVAARQGPLPPPVVKLLLVASSGGHLAELHSLGEFWRAHERTWVSFPTSDAKYLLADERTVWAHHPTNRHLGNLWRNFGLARRVLAEERPDLVLSTGAGVAVPFLAIARRRGIRTVYLESIARIDRLSLTGRIVYPFVDRFWVQWEELAARHRRAEFHGTVVGP
jgi:beta-1,4-N-acetylglucosaminyltransferase